MPCQILKFLAVDSFCRECKYSSEETTRECRADGKTSPCFKQTFSISPNFHKRLDSFTPEIISFQFANCSSTMSAHAFLSFPTIGDYFFSFNFKLPEKLLDFREQSFFQLPNGIFSSSKGKVRPICSSDALIGSLLVPAIVLFLLDKELLLISVALTFDIPFGVADCFSKLGFWLTLAL